MRNSPASSSPPESSRHIRSGQEQIVFCCLKSVWQWVGLQPGRCMWRKTSLSCTATLWAGVANSVCIGPVPSGRGLSEWPPSAAEAEGFSWGCLFQLAASRCGSLAWVLPVLWPATCAPSSSHSLPGVPPSVGAPVPPRSSLCVGLPADSPEPALFIRVHIWPRGTVCLYPTA